MLLFQKTLKAQYGGAGYPTAFGGRGWCFEKAEHSWPFLVLSTIIFSPCTIYSSDFQLFKCICMYFISASVPLYETTYFPGVLAINSWMFYEGKTRFTWCQNLEDMEGRMWCYPSDLCLSVGILKCLLVPCVCLCARVLRGYKKNKAVRKKNMKKLLYFPHLVKIPIGYLAVFKRLRFLLLY